MIHGVFIEQGPKNWQIIQQKDGFADIKLSGYYRNLGSENLRIVYVRVVKEESGDPVIDWKICECSSKDEEGGTWQVNIEKVPAGGLYRIETCLNQAQGLIEWSRRGDMIHHVGVGDLYVIAGQSNSAGYGRDPVYDLPEPGVHLFRNSGIWDMATHPMNDSTNTVHEVNTELSNPGHSPYLNFAKKLKRELGYPIGLIQTAMGGSDLSQWNPNEEGIYYDNMLDVIRMTGNKIKCILWYQGCSDTKPFSADTYYTRFKEMVVALRKDLEDEKIFFLTVQLNRTVDYHDKDEISNECWGKVREAQRHAAMILPDVLIVPSIDCKLSDGIHNSSASNMLLGERLAKAALGGIYGRKIAYEAPNIKKAVLRENKIISLEFDNVLTRLEAREIDIANLPFTVIDEKGKIKVKSYTIPLFNTIVIELGRKVEGAAAVHGAYEYNPSS